MTPKFTRTMEHSYELIYRATNGEAVAWTYDGTDALLEADQVMALFREHWQAEGMPEPVEFLLVARDGEELWSK